MSGDSTKECDKIFAARIDGIVNFERAAILDERPIDGQIADDFDVAIRVDDHGVLQMLVVVPRRVGLKNDAVGKTDLVQGQMREPGL